MDEKQNDSQSSINEVTEDDDAAENSSTKTHETPYVQLLELVIMMNKKPMIYLYPLFPSE